jgi:hypothetical protein
MEPVNNQQIQLLWFHIPLSNRQIIKNYTQIDDTTNTRPNQVQIGNFN